MTLHEIVFLLISYLVGSFPVGFILYFIFEKKDIRSQGSGNIGATNMYRAKGKAAAFTTLGLDMLKGMVPVIYGLSHFDYPLVILGGGAAAVLGHLFPLYIKFKGGKGIATYLGTLAIFHLPAALVFGVAFILAYLPKKYVSAGSLAGVTASFFYLLFTQTAELSMTIFICAILIVSKHHTNIKRIMAGSEAKLIWKDND